MVATLCVPAQMWMPPLGSDCSSPPAWFDDFLDRGIVGQHGEYAFAVVSPPP